MKSAPRKSYLEYQSLMLGFENEMVCVACQRIGKSQAAIRNEAPRWDRRAWRDAREYSRRPMRPASAAQQPRQMSVDPWGLRHTAARPLGASAQGLRRHR